MAVLYVKNKYTPIVLITLVITLAYLILVLYYIQMIDYQVNQYSLSLQEEGYTIEQADHSAVEKYGLMPKNKSTQED